MPLLNYTTKIEPERTISQITSLLGRKGAMEISTIYGGPGVPSGMRWTVNTRHGPREFALPVKINAVYQVMTKERVLPSNDRNRMEQARRTAWRIIKDWVEAQMALLDTEMVELEEIFLPYMVEGGTTLYNALAEREFRQTALPPADTRR